MKVIEHLCSHLYEVIVAAVVVMLLATSFASHAQVMPPTMTICEDARCDAGNGATAWTFQGQQGQEQSGGQVRTLLLERIDAGGVVIRRQDTPGAAIGSEPYTLFIGHVYGDYTTGTMSRHSGGAITSSGEWHGVTTPTVCAASVSVAEAKSIGARAARLKQNTAALGCYLSAARQGDSEAETMAGSLLHDGVGVTHDQAAAFGWLKKAAAANDYRGEMALATMYHLGAGTPKNEELASSWFTKAKQQQAKAEKEAAQKDLFATAVVSAVVLAVVAEGINSEGGSASAHTSQSQDAYRDMVRSDQQARNNAYRGESGQPLATAPQGWNPGDPP